MISPKNNFQNSPHAKGWSAIVDSSQFEAAAIAAILEMQFAYDHPVDGGTAIAQRYEMAGAKRFLKTLSDLNSSAKPVQASTVGKLNHNV